jgi:hypothetical protein
VNVWFERAAGAALAVLMVVHIALRPEHGWVLLWGCDASTIAISVGLLLGAYRLFAAGALFQISVGVPAFIVGLATTYVPNVTGVGVHTLPPLIGAVVIARRGLPGRPAIAAAAGYLGLMAAGYLVAPVAENINFARAVFPPLARLIPSLLLFWLVHLTAVSMVLLGMQTLVRRVARAFSSEPRPAPMPPPDNA